MLFDLHHQVSHVVQLTFISGSSGLRSKRGRRGQHKSHKNKDNIQGNEVRLATEGQPRHTTSRHESDWGRGIQIHGLSFLQQCSQRTSIKIFACHWILYYGLYHWYGGTPVTRQGDVGSCTNTTPLLWFGGAAVPLVLVVCSVRCLWVRFRACDPTRSEKSSLRC